MALGTAWLPYCFPPATGILTYREALQFSLSAEANAVQDLYVTRCRVVAPFSRVFEASRHGYGYGYGASRPIRKSEPDTSEETDGESASCSASDCTGTNSNDEAERVEQHQGVEKLAACVTSTPAG